MSRSRTSLHFFAVCCVASPLAAPAFADVFNMPAGQTSLQMLSVGDAGNTNDPLTDNRYGGVAYSYKIGKHEVTIGQYTQFLNAVAATDTYGLYNTGMASNLNIAGISRSGVDGSFRYSPIGSPNRPIAFVSWGDSARFVNWITNGQPTGTQGAGTTETGSYALNGAITWAELDAINRDPNARYVIPTASEWYKAAYYDPTKGGSNYWLYPMRTDGPIYSAMPPGSGTPDASRTGNFIQDDRVVNSYDNGFAVTGSTVYSSSENYLTDVGAYTSAMSYYGTFDQGGNLAEWDETRYMGDFRGLFGFDWRDPEQLLRSTGGGGEAPDIGNFLYGFRIALVPEPAALALMALGAGVLLRRPAGRRHR